MNDKEHTIAQARSIMLAVEVNDTEWRKHAAEGIKLGFGFFKTHYKSTLEFENAGFFKRTFFINKITKRCGNLLLDSEKRINEGDIQAGSKCAGFRLFNIWVASKSAKDGFYLEIEKKMIELNIAPDVFKALRSYSPY